MARNLLLCRGKVRVFRLQSDCIYRQVCVGLLQSLLRLAPATWSASDIPGNRSLEHHLLIHIVASNAGTKDDPFIV